MCSDHYYPVSSFVPVLQSFSRKVRSTAACVERQTNELCDCGRHPDNVTHGFLCVTNLDGRLRPLHTADEQL